MIKEIEKWGWKLDPNRVIEHDYYMIINNNSCRLYYDKHSRTWIFTKNGKVQFKGEVEKDIEEVLEVLSDIKLVCYA